MWTDEKTFLVIYDGDCGFCQATVNVIKKLDWLNKFTFVPFQEDWVLKKYVSLTREMCEKGIYLVKPDGKYFSGYDAFKIISVYLPVTFLVSWFFFLPGVVQVGRVVYKSVAENRHKINLGGKVCKR